MFFKAIVSSNQSSCNSILGSSDIFKHCGDQGIFKKNELIQDCEDDFLVKFKFIIGIFYLN